MVSELHGVCVTALQIHDLQLGAPQNRCATSYFLSPP